MYSICADRGFADAAAVLGADFAGVLVRDGWVAYRGFEHAPHQTCLAHLLRRCKDLRNDHPDSPGAATVQTVLLDALDLRTRCNAGGIGEHGLAAARGRLGRLIDAPPPLAAAERFAGHLDREFPAVFLFLRDPSIDATNWRAEQAIRPRWSCARSAAGNRTRRGADTQQILASVVRTARQRRLDPRALFTTMLRAPEPIVPEALALPPPARRPVAGPHASAPPGPCAAHDSEPIPAAPRQTPGSLSDHLDAEPVISKPPGLAPRPGFAAAPTRTPRRRPGGDPRPEHSARRPSIRQKPVPPERQPCTAQQRHAATSPEHPLHFRPWSPNYFPLEVLSGSGFFERRACRTSTRKSKRSLINPPGSGRWSPKTRTAAHAVTIAKPVSTISLLLDSRRSRTAGTSLLPVALQIKPCRLTRFHVHRSLHDRSLRYPSLRVNPRPADGGSRLARAPNAADGHRQP